ncbi:MAG: hypothetical protein ACPGTO_11825 [Polaribacter sp.]
MKKYIFLLILVFIGISACEKDDFCVQNPVTPNLVLRFYDKNDTSQLKAVQRLSLHKAKPIVFLQTNLLIVLLSL